MDTFQPYKEREICKCSVSVQAMVHCTKSRSTSFSKIGRSLGQSQGAPASWTLGLEGLH